MKYLLYAVLLAACTLLSLWLGGNINHINQQLVEFFTQYPVCKGAMIASGIGLLAFLVTTE